MFDIENSGVKIPFDTVDKLIELLCNLQDVTYYVYEQGNTFKVFRMYKNDMNQFCEIKVSFVPVVEVETIEEFAEVGTTIKFKVRVSSEKEAEFGNEITKTLNSIMKQAMPKNIM